MKLLKNHTHIHGFEDYNIVSLGDSCFWDTYGSFWIPYNFHADTGTYIINKDLPVGVHNEVNASYYWIKEVVFEPELVKDNKELLDTASKLFVHPSCKLSRSLMAEKYKKSLNPYLSDAVVIPKPDYNDFNLRKNALFINEQSKVIIMVWMDNDDAIKRISAANEGDKFQALITLPPDDSYGDRKPYTVNDLLNAEFFYYGEVLYVPNSHSWASDVLTHQLPVDKIVFEESAQESLGNETNQLTFDSLTSIKDMLESSDENTVAAGLKSLSMMDWMHYPNSVRLIFRCLDNYRWRYNNASNSTSVKYMLNTLSNSNTRRHWPGSYDNDIYEQDYELFKQLIVYYDNVSKDNVLGYLVTMASFVTVVDNEVTPVLKRVV